MGFFSWRKTKQAGPVNVTASSGGLGVSVRLPGGLHIGLSRRGLSFSLSKGGLSFRKTVHPPHED